MFEIGAIIGLILSLSGIVYLFNWVTDQISPVEKPVIAPPPEPEEPKEDIQEMSYTHGDTTVSWRIVKKDVS